MSPRSSRFIRSRSRTVLASSAIVTAALIVSTGSAGPAISATTGEAAPRTVLVSRSSTGELGNDDSGAVGAAVAISADGRYVAFDSRASNLVPGDTNGLFDVFLRDNAAGTVTRVSVTDGGGQANGRSAFAAVSDDGRVVAFVSEASNLVPGDTNGASDVFVRDLRSATTSRISVSSPGDQANAESINSPVLSADGRLVAFTSLASNLVGGDTNAAADVFLRDREAERTSRLSISSAGTEGNGDSGVFAPSAMSSDGRFVAFTSLATNLVAGDTNGLSDVFVRDTVDATTERVSLSSGGAQGNGTSLWVVLSAGGRFAAFSSDATNLVTGDTNRQRDVFVRDRAAATTARVSVSSSGGQGNASSCCTKGISEDGRYVAFSSLASNLVPEGDSNFTLDVFFRDRASGTTTLVSIALTGGAGDLASGNMSLSDDARAVVFGSSATDLVRGDTNEASDVFVRGPLT